MVLEIDTVSAQYGNRTHYSNGLIRNGSAIATDYTNATGRVVIKSLSTYLPSENLRQYQSIWAISNDVNLVYDTVDTNSETYHANLLQSCTNSASDYDLFLIDTTQTRVFENCLVDLFSWNDKFGKNMERSTIENAVVRDKLLSLPFSKIS